MKQTMKYLSIAALVVVGANMMSCNKVELSTEQLQEDKTTSNVVTLTTTVGLDGGATTRALTSGGVKTFAAGETIALVYKKTGGATAVAVSEALDDGDIASGAKSATFTFTLEEPDNTQNVTYVYPAAMAKADGSINYDALDAQDGTLATLESNLDLATYTAAWNGTALPNVTLDNQLAILAITLKDNAATPTEITGSITGMTVSDGTNTYTVTRSAAAGPIYVAIQPTSSADIEVTATDGTKNYTKSLTGKTYEAGNGYSVSWRMTEVPAAKAAAEATAEDKGKLIGTDGKIYADVAAATAAGTTAVAKIIYIGATGHGTYTHGLALALTDEGQMAWEAAKTACNTTKNTSTPVTDATWLLASKAQWNYMMGINGAGSDTALREGFSGITGASDLQSGVYWSSTERNADNAWFYGFGYQDWASYYKSSVNVYVRACLAF